MFLQLGYVYLLNPTLVCFICILYFVFCLLLYFVFCVRLFVCFIGGSTQPSHLAEETGYSLEELIPVMIQLDKSRQNPKHNAVRKKYTHQQYQSVSTMSFEKLHYRKYFNNYQKHNK